MHVFINSFKVSKKCYEEMLLIFQLHNAHVGCVSLCQTEKF
jgi:hypothetical protein